MEKSNVSLTGAGLLELLGGSAAITVLMVVLANFLG